MLKELIRQGEGETLDFKQTINSPRKIAKTLVAFANTKGGKILVGVKDNGGICGVRPEEERHMLEGAAHLHCKPVVDIVFSEEVMNGKTVLVAEVPESKNKPHFVRGDDKKWWAYIRVKDQCLLASKVMLDVMRYDSKGKPATIEYGEAEKSLLHHLQLNQKVTIQEFCKFAGIPRWQASRILVNLVRMDIVKVLATERTDYYTL